MSYLDDEFPFDVGRHAENAVRHAYDEVARLFAERAKWLSAIVRTIDPRDIPHVVLKLSPGGSEKLMLRERCLAESRIWMDGETLRFTGTTYVDQPPPV